MTDRTGAVTFRGTPMTLLGAEVRVGEKAPDVELIGNDMAPVRELAR